MTKRPLYISTDIETNGPLIGINSMLSLGSAAFSETGDIVSTFEVNLEELPFGLEDEKCMKEFWANWPEAYATARENPQPCSEAMGSYLAWLKTFEDRSLVFVAYPANFDFSFVQYYLLNYTGECPFGYCALDMKSFAMALLGKTFEETYMDKMPARWLAVEPNPHPHVALHDAIHQGRIFMQMLKDAY